MRISIYGHEDPRNGVIRYVGQTEDMYRRFIEHISFEKPVEPKDFWIQELKDLNLMLIMRTLEVVDSRQAAREREAYWIHHCLYLAIKANVTLFNRHFPINKSAPPKLEDNTLLLSRLETIPKWESKLNHLESVIGQDMSEAIYAIWGVRPGRGDRYKEARTEYDVLSEAIRLKLQQMGGAA